MLVKFTTKFKTLFGGHAVKHLAQTAMQGGQFAALNAALPFGHHRIDGKQQPDEVGYGACALAHQSHLVGVQSGQVATAGRPALMAQEVIHLGAQLPFRVFCHFGKVYK